MIGAGKALPEVSDELLEPVPGNREASNSLRAVEGNEAARTSPYSEVISDIEVLRAIAILITAFSHFGDLFPWGNEFYQAANEKFAFWGGVDLFFAVSGFVISKRLLRRLTWRDIKAFWTRRIFRILPSAWVWLLLTVLLSVVWNTSGTFRSPRANLLDTAAGMFHFANIRHHFQVKGEMPWGGNSVYWSLSLEEQFYLLLPLLLLFSGRHFLKVAACILLAQLFLPREQGSLLWEIRTDALFLGVLLAAFSSTDYYQKLKPSFCDNFLARQVVVLPLLLSLLIIPSQHFRVVPFYTGVLALASAALVWLASYDESYFFRQKHLRSCLLWIGSRSFAIYLIHIPSYRIANELWFRIKGAPLDRSYTFELFLTAMALLLVLAELNFRFLETPLRRYGARLSKSMLASA